jgi:protease PrsW
MSVMACPRCGTRLRRSAFCASCGTPAGDGDVCPNCRAPYEGPNYCPACGYRVGDAVRQRGLRGREAIAFDPLGPPPPALQGFRRRSRWRRWTVGCGCLPATLLVVSIIAGAAAGDTRALVLATVAAVVPAMIYLWFVLSLDRYEKEPLRVVGFAFGWGAVAAVLFSLIAEVLFAGLIVVAAGEDAASVGSLVIGAPVIEEACKGLALLLLLWFYRHEIDSVLDGLIYGAVIGLGFAMTENIVYFISAYQEEGLSGLGELFIVRAVINGFGHAMYTGVLGAAIGWSRVRYSRGASRIFVPIAGYVAAVLLHALWNGGVLVIAALQGDDATLWSVMLVEVPLFVLPPLFILYRIARRGAESERLVLREHLADEVTYGVLTPDELAEVVDHDRRKEAMRRARGTGFAAWQAQRRFYAAAADLAFRKHHLASGQALHPDDRLHILNDRYQIARLRHVLGRNER